MNLSHCNLVAAFICVAVGLAEFSIAQESPLVSAAKEFAISADEIAQTVAQTATFRLHDGKTLKDATIKAITSPRRQKGFVNSVSVQLSGEARPRRLQAGLIREIRIEERVYSPAPVGAGIFVLTDVGRRKAVVTERLEKVRAHLWEPYTDEQQAEFVQEQRTYLEKIKQAYDQLPLKLYETTYFLFLSDMPANQVGAYIRNLDQMNVRMGQAFGIVPGQNVWKGKAVVIAFSDRQTFLRFEKQFMDNPTPGSAQGICHANSNGEVIVACFRGNDPSYFAIVLVHETAHGYLHRHISSVPIPTWLNEGVADWIANIAVLGDRAVEQRQLRAIERLKKTRSLGGRFFDSDRIQRWQYGVASSMVDLLVRKNDMQFRLLIDGLKEGYSVPESLNRSYGITLEELTAIYGNSIRLPNLTP